MNAVLVAILALLLTLVTTPLVRQVGLRWGWVDQPGARKLHHKPMVRVGGIAIALSTLTALLGITTISPLSGSEMQTIQAILIGGTAFFAIGLADDLLNLHPVLRLLLQAAVTGLVWNLGIRVESLPIPGMGLISLGWLSLPITFLWLAGLANAINWMDGMDGLAAGISTVMAMTLALLAPNQGASTLTALALGGATLGFLRYNAAPAKLFMGDGGSYVIGFLLAAVSATGWSQVTDGAIALVPYLVLGVPILDMALVILTRLLEGQSPLFADQRHLHHRLLQLGLTRPTVVTLIYLLVFLACLSTALLTHTMLGWIGLSLTAILFVASYPALWPVIANGKQASALK